MAIVLDNVIRRKGYAASYQRDRFKRRFHNEFFPLSRVHAIISLYANTPRNRIFCLLWINRILILHAAFHFVNWFCRCDSERSHMQMSHYNAMHKWFSINCSQFYSLRIQWSGKLKLFHGNTNHSGKMLDNNESILLFIFDGIEFFRLVIQTERSSINVSLTQIIPMDLAWIKHNFVLSIFSVCIRLLVQYIFSLWFNTNLT